MTRPLLIFRAARLWKALIGGAVGAVLGFSLPAAVSAGFSDPLLTGGPPGYHAAALSAVAGGATFAGSTSQDAPLVVQLSRNGKRVARFVIHWDATCTSGEKFTHGGSLAASAGPTGKPVVEHPYLPIDKTGSFKGSSQEVLDLGGGSSGTLIQDFRGRLRSSKGAGTWHGHLDIIDTQSGQKINECDTGIIRWSAPKPQALFYGGATSQGGPVVVQVSRDGRKVRRFRIGWVAGCTPEGMIAIGDSLGNFRISKRGKFGDTFPQRFVRPDKSESRFDYEVAGTVGRTKARGSFHVRETDIDGNGVTTATCDSPRMSWSAKQ